MDVAVSQGMEGLKILDLVNLKTDIRVGKDWCTGGPAQVEDLIPILFYPVEFDPGNMVFHRVGMRHLMAHNNAYNVFTFLMRMDGGSFPDVIRELAQREGIDLPEQKKESVLS